MTRYQEEEATELTVIVDQVPVEEEEATERLEEEELKVTVIVDQVPVEEEAT